MLQVERNHGVDLLKCISMIMVLGLHLNAYGGFLNTNGPFCYKLLITFSEHLCIVAVDVFVIISSWFLRYSSFKLSKILSIILAIIFWTATSLIVAYCLGEEVSPREIFKSIPFFGRAYDFMSGYIVLYICAPLLNNMLNNSSRNQVFMLGFGSFVIYSLMSPITTSYYLGIGGGYSAFWFICLYLMTASIRDIWGGAYFSQNGLC